MENSKKNGKDKFLIDGFPRNKDNFDGWNKEMTSVATVEMVLVFKCDPEVINPCNGSSHV